MQFIKKYLQSAKLLALVLILLPAAGFSKDTFSIVAVDSITGEIGSAGATCGDSIIWPGTPGAYIISDVIPGVGAIHTQCYHNETNQLNARERMLEGDSPAEIMDWLENNDVNNMISRRQYGAVDLNDGSPRSAGYTGSNCDDYKDHVPGPGYAIQGNILLGKQILDSMEVKFIETPGCLADKLMAAMQGANVPGADERCLDEGVSSLSAFIRVALPDDADDDLTIDINVAGTAYGVEPIDILQSRYDTWKADNNYDCEETVSVFPSGHLDNGDNLTVTTHRGNIYVTSGQNITGIDIRNIRGNLVFKKNITPGQTTRISSDKLPNGLYLIIGYNKNSIIPSRVINMIQLPW